MTAIEYVEDYFSKMSEKEKISDEKLDLLEDMLIEEYNKITSPYRIKFKYISELKKQNYKSKIQNCVHEYVRYNEYHNDRYFQCKKCGHEKY